MIAAAIGRAWAAGCGPGAAPMTIDLDSTICEVHGKAKHGAAYGYTKVLGYHPLLATRAGTGEVLHARLRKGSSQRGHRRFVEELIARVRRAGATGAVTVRADAGFWSYALIDTLNRLGVSWSITVRINPAIRRAIEAGRAPTRLTGKVEQTLWPVATPSSPAWTCPRWGWTSSTATTPAVELAIRDLKEGAGLEHRPSGHFFRHSGLLCGEALQPFLGGGVDARTRAHADQHPARWTGGP